jgi:hypothetical protein
MLIFHQNMRVYGGGAPARNAAFTVGLTAINAVTGPTYAAAGFTEIINAGAGIHQQLNALSQTLDPGLNRLLVIEVGTTVSGNREYIGISWDPAVLPVQHAGRVLRNPVNKNWVAYNAPVAAGAGAPGAGAVAANTLELPGGVALAADQRGIAYIAGTYGGTEYLIAFMHNMYGVGDRTTGFANLGIMADRARRAIGGAYANAEVVVGGDFNVPPRAYWRRRRQPVDLENLAARVGGGVAGAYVLTTAVHTYDFWASALFGRNDTHAAVHTQTRTFLASDHAAITLDAF